MRYKQRLVDARVRYLKGELRQGGKDSWQTLPNYYTGQGQAAEL